MGKKGKRKRGTLLAFHPLPSSSGVCRQRLVGAQALGVLELASFYQQLSPHSNSAGQPLLGMEVEEN
jgi:hypothetical protein